MHFGLLYYNFWLALNLRIISCNQKKRATAPGHLQVWKKRRKRYNLLKVTEIVLLFLLTCLIFNYASKPNVWQTTPLVEEFMDLSTIHGLQYLKTPKRLLGSMKETSLYFPFQERLSGVSWRKTIRSLFSFNFSQILLREDFLVVGVHLCLRDRNLSDQIVTLLTFLISEGVLVFSTAAR